MRDLFRDAPDVLPALKPCWAMSPLVVSQLLPADSRTSTSSSSTRPPGHARPTRSRRSCAAGGSSSPATSTSCRRPTSSPSERRRGRRGQPTRTRRIVAVTAGFESILDALGASSSTPRMLSWHYRSRDERLIAFSNAHLYDRALTTSPASPAPSAVRTSSCRQSRAQHGRKTASPPRSTASSSSSSSTPRRRPDESLGVIAMGIKHANRIEEALRAALRDRPDLDDVLRREPAASGSSSRTSNASRATSATPSSSPIGYGKNADGRMLYRFGPLNNEGGERRLNVAVTRAKHRMTARLLVQPQRHGPGPLRRATASSCCALYLAYAAAGGAQPRRRRHRQARRSTRSRSTSRRACTRPASRSIAQYGVSGYRIDFAAKHPDPARPDRPRHRVRRRQLPLLRHRPRPRPPPPGTPRTARLDVPPHLVAGLVHRPQARDRQGARRVPRLSQPPTSTRQP